MNEKALTKGEKWIQMMYIKELTNREIRIGGY